MQLLVHGLKMMLRGKAYIFDATTGNLSYIRQSHFGTSADDILD